MGVIFFKKYQTKGIKKMVREELLKRLYADGIKEVNLNHVSINKIMKVLHSVYNDFLIQGLTVDVMGICFACMELKEETTRYDGIRKKYVTVPQRYRLRLYRPPKYNKYRPVKDPGKIPEEGYFNYRETKKKLREKENSQ